MTELKPGDILFFRPEVVDPTNLESFPSLAAVVQSLPYGDETSHPWHHVAIVVDTATARPQVVEFKQADGGRAGWDGDLVKRALHVGDGQAFDVVRRDGSAEEIVQAALDLLSEPKITYSTTGLLGFAVAMQARIFVAGKGRADAFNLAWGAEATARAADARAHRRSETCVTSVLLALANAGVRLEVAEPPLSTVDYTYLIMKYMTPLKQLYEIVQGGATPGARDDEVLLTEEETVHAYGDPILQTVPAVDLIGLTSAYVNGLSNVIRNDFSQAAGGRPTVAALVAKGADSSKDLSASWLVSPAMLYEALAGAGFTVVS